nr:MAG TPA: hypothetical protein [Caudoviricetes sp.]
MAIRANLDALIANSTGLKKAFGESYRLKKHLERPMNVEIFGESFGLLKTEPKRMQNERMLIKANAIHLMQQGESDNTIKEKIATWGNNVKIAVVKAWEALVGLITQLVRKVIGIRANARRTIKAIDTVLKRNVTKTDAIEVKLYSFPFDKKGMDNKNEGTKSYIDKKFDELTKMMDQVTPDSTPKLLSDEQIKTLKDDTKNEIRSKEQVAKNITATQAKAALRVERFILSMAEKTCDAAEKSEQEARKALKRIKDLYSDKKAKELSKNESEEAQAKKKEDFINKRKAAHQISQQITALSGATTAYYSAHITNAGRLMKVLKGGSETAKKENKDKKETKKEEAK